MKHSKIWIASTLALLVSFTVTGQNLVRNGDFEDFYQATRTQIANNCYWGVKSGQTPFNTPIQNYSLTLQHTQYWTEYYYQSAAAMPLYFDARDIRPGAYEFDLANQISCTGVAGSDYFTPFNTPGESGIGQPGTYMLQDGNLIDNATTGYVKMTAENPQPFSMASYITDHDFIEGQFIKPLDLFQKYRVSFKYSIPCDEDPSGPEDNKIIFSLFDQELKDLMGSGYGNGYIFNLNNNSPIDNENFHLSTGSNSSLEQGNSRLKVLEYEIPQGVAPCSWQTVTAEFTIADLMNDAANNTFDTNPLFTNWNNAPTPLGFMNNAHMLDADYYAQHGNGWYYSSPIYLTQFISGAIQGSAKVLSDFKRIFGITVRGLQNVYIDDVKVEEAGCNLNANFTVEQSCFTDEEGNRFVRFDLNAQGTTSNPYMFSVRKLPGSNWTQLPSATVALGPTSSYTVPYVAGEQYQFSMGTWQLGSDTCGWTPTFQTITVDPDGNFFPVAPTFQVNGLQNSIFPSSYFAIHADPTTTADRSEWAYKIHYTNGSASNWLGVNTNGNPTGDGNLEFIIWFDCLDTFWPFLEPDAAHSNVAYVQVRRTTFGTCDNEGMVEIQNYTNCQVEGREEPKNKLSDEGLARVKRTFDLDASTVRAGELSLLAQGLVVYPNPGQDVVKVAFGGPGTYSLVVTDLQGKTVVQRYQTRDQEVSLDVSNLTPGIYLLEVSDGTDRVTRKLMKE